MVILFDGPCHYIEKRKKSESFDFDSHMDLSGYILPKSKLVNNLLEKNHKSVVRFDY
jgi:hypothetical protein